MDEGIDLSDLYDLPSYGEINPFPSKILQRVKPVRRCSHCKQKGHDRRTCPSRRKCGICRKVGHNRRTCPSRVKKPIRAANNTYPKAILTRAINTQYRCKCGSRSWAPLSSCPTNSCKECCHLRNCRLHGKQNLRNSLHHNTLKFERRQYQFFSNAGVSWAKFTSFLVGLFCFLYDLLKIGLLSTMIGLFLVCVFQGISSFTVLGEYIGILS
jgi:hypothetical protein